MIPSGLVDAEEVNELGQTLATVRGKTPRAWIGWIVFATQDALMAANLVAIPVHPMLEVRSLTAELVKYFGSRLGDIFVLMFGNNAPCVTISHCSN